MLQRRNSMPAAASLRIDVDTSASLAGHSRALPEDGECYRLFMSRKLLTATTVLISPSPRIDGAAA
jgi:hypothetical protein